MTTHDSEPRTQDERPASKPSINITDAQVGVIGDNVTVYGGIHYHVEPPANPRERRHRAAMLKLVHNTWIKGLLEQSLHGAAMLELGMEYNPEAVDHPWDMVVQMPEYPDKQLPSGTRIVDVFDEIGGSLLILGKPGSGKTTMLLELARDLIVRAEQDDTLPIPVVFNLSSWAVRQQPFQDWLIDELQTKYYIPKKIAQIWIKEDTLLLLLDGLDEVKADTRDKCVATINTFRQAHFVPLAVCSRIAEYETLIGKLYFQGAISLRSLSPAMIDTYLTGRSIELQAVQATLTHDPILRKMAQSPLFLSIMALAYRGKTFTELQPLTTTEARRQHLFHVYIQRMFQRRSKKHPYTQEQILSWLFYLAQQMTVHSQSLFLIEGLQPNWLPPRTSQRARRLGQLLVGLLVGLIFGRSGGLNDGVRGVLVFGLLFGLVGWVLGDQRTVKPVEVLIWSWRVALRDLSRERIKILGCGFTGLMLALLLGAGWLVSLGIGLYFWLGTLLFLGLMSLLEEGELASKTVPNEGIRQSVKNSMFGTLLWVLVTGTLVGLPFAVPNNLGQGLFIGTFAGLVVGLFVGLNLGGLAVLLHISIRYVLHRNNHLPWRIVYFLDYCADRIFLRKVGGGYIFIHRLFQEYFASLTPEDIDHLAAEIEGERS